MSNAVCIGGIQENGRPLRLLDENGHNQLLNTDITVGDILDVEYKERMNKIPPHTEDVLITKRNSRLVLKKDIKLGEYLINKVKIKILKGRIENLFDGKLRWSETGTGYVTKYNEVPDFSTGFWISDIDLNMYGGIENVRYHYLPELKGFDNSDLRNAKQRNIKFVGFQKPVQVIPAGTLIRVSLARWWKPIDSINEERCYLQISGWYDLEEGEDLGSFIY